MVVGRERGCQEQKLHDKYSIRLGGGSGGFSGRDNGTRIGEEGVDMRRSAGHQHQLSGPPKGMVRSTEQVIGIMSIQR